MTTNATSFEGMVSAALLGDDKEKELQLIRIDCKHYAMTHMTCNCGAIHDQRRISLLRDEKNVIRAACCQNCRNDAIDKLKKVYGDIGLPGWTFASWNGLSPVLPMRLNAFVDTGNRVMEATAPKRERIPSTRQLLTGKLQSKNVRPYAAKIHSMTGLLCHQATLIIRTGSGSPTETGSPGDNDKAAMIARVFKSYATVDNELGTGDYPIIGENRCVRMIDKKTGKHVCTVNDLFLRAAEKHGNVYRWYPSTELSSEGTPYAVVGVNTAGERRAVIACVIDEQ